MHKVFKAIIDKCHILGILKGSYVWGLEFIAKRLKNQNLEDKKHKYINRYLKDKYLSRIENSSLIEKLNVNRSLADNYNIWVFWYQGEDNMPDIVKGCYMQLKHCCSENQIVNLIHKDNIDEYINFPTYIKEKLVSGQLSFTHYSDILRFALLYYYGGLWIDSTVWITEPISNQCLNTKYWSIRLKEPLFAISISKCKWSTFIWNIKVSNDLFAKYVLSFLLEYWKDEDCVIDYLLLDYVIYLIGKEYPLIGGFVFNFPKSNPNLYYLNSLLATIYSDELYHKITSDTTIFKLSYKNNLLNLDYGDKITFYSKLIKNE